MNSQEFLAKKRLYFILYIPHFPEILLIQKRSKIKNCVERALQQNNTFIGSQHWMKYKFGKHNVYRQYFFLIPVGQLGPKCSILLFAILELIWFKYIGDFKTPRSRVLISCLCLRNSVLKKGNLPSSAQRCQKQKKKQAKKHS